MQHVKKASTVKAVIAPISNDDISLARSHHE
jgi:hypothetical protein